MRLLSLTIPATRCPPASRSCLTSFSSSPPMAMGPTTPSTTGRGIWTPMGVPQGSLSKRASLLCWASVAHPMSLFPEGSGLMERTVPTALLRSWLRCHGLSLSNLADRPPKSWITTGKSTNAGPGYSAGIASCVSCCRAGFGIVVPVFQPFWRGNSASVWGQGWLSALLAQSSACRPVGGFSSPRCHGHWWQPV